MSATHTYINNWIEKHFSSRKITIIDYGCGNGDLINYLDEKIIKKYTGYDVSADCIKVAKEKFSKNKFLFKKITPDKPPQLGKENSIDLLILIGVVQYLSKGETEFLFKQANRILEKSGRMVISCSVNHRIYRFFNLYRFFTPNHYIDREKFIQKASQFGLKLEFSQEKGLFIAPLFSNVFFLFFFSFV